MATATEVRARPIPFTVEMVRATIVGRKGQTRRVMKPQPEPCEHRQGKHWWPSNAVRMMVHIEDELQGGDATMAGCFCPYGNIGEALWVRETWALVKPWYDPETRSVEDFEEWKGPLPKSKPEGWAVVYRADWGSDYEHPDDRPFRWRPSIHMRRWASRLTPEITGVRVERLQEITREDVRAEGIPDTYGEGADRRFPEMEPHVWDNMTWREQWAYCWDSINAKRGHGWDLNRWVWVIEFRNVSPEV